jgi:hypothetical protein
VLALSVSQTGDRRPKDSDGGKPPLQNVQENHEQRNQQANLSLFNDDYSNDLRKKKEG